VYAVSHVESRAVPALDSRPHRVRQVADPALFKLIEVYKTSEACEAHKVGWERTGLTTLTLQSIPRAPILDSE
jgi:hypothetical protein